MKNYLKFFAIFAIIPMSAVMSACQPILQKEIIPDNTVKTPKVEMLKPIFKSYPVSVNYNRSLNEMFMAGRYDLMNDSEITVEIIPAAIRGKVNVDLYLIYLKYSTTSENAIQNMDRSCFAPAKVEHLLAFGEKYPLKQTEFLIVALGSPMVDQFGRQYVSYLDRIDDIYQWDLPKRCLYLFSELKLGTVWPEETRFLAVRKPNCK